MELKKMRVQKWKKQVVAGGYTFLNSTAMFAGSIEGLDPVKSTAEWVTDFVINVSLVLMVLVVIMKLMQVQFAGREWQGVISPVIITSLIVGAKFASPVLIRLMGYSV